MFFFRKKSKVDNVKSNNVEENNLKVDKKLSIENAKKLEQEIPDKLDSKRKDVINKIASLYYEGEDIDHAIKYYELSIEENKEIGKAYSDLLKLYNIKRKEATSKNDSESAKVYLDKIENLMKLSKDVMRGRV